MPIEINVVSLTTCQVAPAGDHVRLNFDDALGRAATLSLPSACVQQLLMTLPHLLCRALQAQHGDGSLRAVFPLGEWRLEAAAGSQDLIFTLTTPDRFEISFFLNEQVFARMLSGFQEHRPGALHEPPSLVS
jgi:hypothetical protein